MFGRLWMRLGLLATTLVVASPATAQSRLFSDEAPLQMTITAPFPSLVRAAKTSTNPFPAALSVTDGAGPAQSMPVQLRPRGLTRRTGGYCQFPPLSMTFDKATAHGSVFQGQHRLKLVTYCNTPADQEQRIVLEYLVYRLYNLVTPMSYRVRAADVTYRTSEKDAGLRRFGYLIEDIDDVAKRNHRERLEATSHQVSAAQLDSRAAARAAMLEFMIGNLDWDFLAAPAGAECCHNSRFIAAKDAKPAAATAVVPIPYDFDYSGFVDAPYALPPEGLKVTSVKDRIYRGYCVSAGDIPAVVEEFRGHRGEMMALINGYPRLNPRVRSKTASYLDKFFAVLDDPARLQIQVVKRCR